MLKARCLQCVHYLIKFYPAFEESTTLHWCDEIDDEVDPFWQGECSDFKVPEQEDSNSVTDTREMIHITY